MIEFAEEIRRIRDTAALRPGRARAMGGARSFLPTPQAAWELDGHTRSAIGGNPVMLSGRCEWTAGPANRSRALRTRAECEARAAPSASLHMGSGAVSMCARFRSSTPGARIFSKFRTGAAGSLIGFALGLGETHGVGYHISRRCLGDISVRDISARRTVCDPRMVRRRCCARYDFRDQILTTTLSQLPEWLSASYVHPGVGVSLADISGISTHVEVGRSVLADGSWHHVCVVLHRRVPPSVTLFADGAHDERVLLDGPVGNLRSIGSSGPLVMGNSDGAIREVRDTAEIQPRSGRDPRGATLRRSHRAPHTFSTEAFRASSSSQVYRDVARVGSDADRCLEARASATACILRISCVGGAVVTRTAA